MGNKESTWSGLIRGDDFQVAFKKLGGLRALTSVPFMALTTTASPKTRSDIIVTWFAKTSGCVRVFELSQYFSIRWSYKWALCK